VYLLAWISSAPNAGTVTVSAVTTVLEPSCHPLTIAEPASGLSPMARKVATLSVLPPQVAATVVLLEPVISQSAISRFAKGMFSSSCVAVGPPLVANAWPVPPIITVANTRRAASWTPMSRVAELASVTRSCDETAASGETSPVMAMVRTTVGLTPFENVNVGVPELVNVPLMTPVVAWNETPVGSPVAEQVTGPGPSMWLSSV
jgi:hypothetical protein